MGGKYRHTEVPTLGHLEKAVVLELTLKHVKTLTALTEQLHQKIIALQNGDRSLKSPPQSDLDAFHSGFQTCTKEVLHYLCRSESWTSQEQRGVQLVGHLHSVCTRFLPGSPHLIPKLCGAKGRWSPQEKQQQQQQQQQQQKRPGGTPKQETQPHCVPVIQRTQNWSRGPATPHPPLSGTEQAGEHDTDTDSGYGGEYEGKTTRGGFMVKQEPTCDVEEVPEGVKRRRLENGSPSAATVRGAGVGGRADPVLLNPLMALGVGAGCGLGGSLLGQAPTAPFCLPFYFLAPSSVAAAYMQPFLEKVSPEKSLYPAGGAAGPFPFIYPGISVQGAAAAFPSLAVAAPAATLAPLAEKGSSLLGTAPCFPTGAAPASQPPPLLFPCKPAELNTDPDRCPSPKSDLQPGRDRPLQADAMLSSI
ncbi:class E basic helix-loop-helix protein 41 [Protobothrops mucrosquamatus]|uniref:class E basic helix-loop-helix protein 41 n=1 Tax=Protobothrops mucrosquamatus TaxID=103944 RepID=UPI0010FB2D58|nr:class E basic helix-loop-helix protein 41 [Protobothrops mucrosquamatus]